jgi:hypothetical protein
MECHSPILAATVGRSAMYLRQSTDTWKGQMFPDLGLGDRLIQLDTTEGDEIATRLLQMHNHYPEAITQTSAAVKTATGLFLRALQVIATTMGSNHVSTNQTSKI